MRVVIADDSVLIREGIRGLLDSAGIECSATAADFDGTIAAVRADPPDVVIADLRMPPTFTDEGIRTAALIAAELRIPTIVLSQYREVSFALRLLREGPGGYLLKDSIIKGSVLVDAVRRVGSGETVVDPALVQDLVDAEPAQRALDRLSAREREVLSLVAEGHTDAVIASKLWLTKRTVEAHIRSIQTKLGLSELEGYNKRVRSALIYLESV